MRRGNRFFCDKCGMDVTHSTNHADCCRGYKEERYRPPMVFPDNKPWVCPKCGCVWGPKVNSCSNCNSKIKSENA